MSAGAVSRKSFFWSKDADKRSVARAHGMSRLYVTCTEDNTASYRTIEGLGGTLLEICDVPREYFAWFEGIKPHRIYQVNL